MEKSVKSTNVIRVYDRLKQSPVSIEDLYKWVNENGMQISRRTVYRYLNNLAESIRFNGEKLVLTTNEFNKKVWKIEQAGKSRKADDFYFLDKIAQLPLPENGVEERESYDVEVEFSPTSANAISQIAAFKNWSILTTDSGNLLLKCQAALSKDLIGLILYFQDRAVVVKPARLKALVLEKLQKVMGNYRDEMVSD